jgi:ubiquinol-cytochrome c reductase iron-sulfur subunit
VKLWRSRPREPRPAFSRPDPPPTPGEGRTELLVLGLFGITGMTGFGLLLLYAFGGQTQLEGILLFAALASIGAGIVLWGQRLMPTRVHIEPRGQIGGGAQAIADLEETLTEEAGFTRRKLLLVGLAGAIASLGAALTIPVLSLGPAPGRSLFETSWRSGRRLATEGGEPIRASDLPIGGVVTVFPDGDATDPNAATLLIHIGEDPLDAQPFPPGAPVSPGPQAPGATAVPGTPGTSAPLDASPGLGDPAPVPNPAAFVAYSKICTHAGCPVGLYRSDEHVLVCPCHQSEFDVLDGAKPINGPAARALPPLPFRLEADGTFTALGDFPEPVGPSFWDMHL